MIAFLKANPKFYNLSKIRFKKRFYLRDMCAQSFLIKFERQSTSLYFIAHCSRLINTINKRNDFLESLQQVLYFFQILLEPNKIRVSRRGTKSLLLFLGSCRPLFTQTLIKSSYKLGIKCKYSQKKRNSSTYNLPIFIFIAFSNKIQ